jgi:hypothetical protein
VIKEKVVRQMIVDRKGDIHQLKTDCLELMKQSWEGTEVEDDVAMLFISYKA